MMKSFQKGHKYQKEVDNLFTKQNPANDDIAMVNYLFCE